MFKLKTTAPQHMVDFLIGCPLTQVIINAKNVKTTLMNDAKPTYCYKNATYLSTLSPDIEYVEGLARHPRDDTWYPHAWCYDTKRKVIIDPTWDVPHASYAGTMIPADILVDHIVNQGYYGVFNGPKGFNRSTINRHEDYFYA